MHNHNFLSIATAPVLTEKTAQALELNKILKERRKKQKKIFIRKK